MDKVYTQHWINLEGPIREHLRKVFSVGRTGPTEVRDQTLISDGTTNEDLNRAFTKASMEAYVGSTDSFPHLWTITVSKAKSEVYPAPIEIKTETPIIETPVIGTASGLIPETPVAPIEENIPKPFCDTCDSKGIRHKADCPNKIF